MYRVGKMGFLSVGDVWSCLDYHSEVIFENDVSFVLWKGNAMDVPKGYMDLQVIYLTPYDKGIRIMLK